jgi:ACT domain-containing protein
MPLSVVLGNVLEDNIVMESRKNVNVSRTVNYKWKENLKLEFVESLKSNEIQLCWVV